MGGDPNAMRQAAYEFEQLAEKIRSNTVRVGQDLSETWWKGPDAERFRSGWAQQHQTTTNHVAGQLQQFARTLRSEATRQERVSGQ